MEVKILAEKLNKIEMPKDMQERILQNCYLEMEGNHMRKRVKIRKPTMVAASLVLCLCLTGVTALATTGKLKGYFKDITGWNGAVIGTAYEQATEEIQLSIAEVTDTLAVAVTMVNPKDAPYVYLETFGIESYKIIDKDGKVIVKGDATEMATVTDGKVMINIPLDNVFGGEYKLVINEMVGGAKAEQPLVIRGEWECEFTK